MSKHLTPLDVLERLVGPLPILAEIAGKHAKVPYLWRRASKWRDAGDLPSTREARSFLAYAAARGILLTADHLIWGASEAEIDALIAEMGAGQVHPEAAE